MGTKISALTETGSAPTGAYYPLEYDNANYKISTETLRANLGGKYVEGYAVSIGGTTVADGALLTVTHNLGTEDVIVQIYIADDADGTNNVMLNNQSDESASFLYDYQVQTAATNSIKVQLSASGWTKNDGTTTAIHTNYTDKFIKVVVLSAGSAGTNKYVADWATSHGGVTVENGATLTITHNLGTADVQTMVYVNSSASDTNAQEVGMMVHNSAGTQFDCGCLVTSLATNSLVVQLGEDGYNDITVGGGLATTNFTDKFIKVVVIG